MKLIRLWPALTTALGLLCLLQASIARADPGVRYVSTEPGCGGRSPCYRSIQAAVDAAEEGDEIRIAAGTYAGTSPATVDGRTYTQTVMITKSLTLQGGYSVKDWSVLDPLTNPTVLDAQRRGRCISVVGQWGSPPSVTLAGLVITGGDYTGLGNPPGVGEGVCGRAGTDCGGGLFAHAATLVLRDSLLHDNIASRTRPFSDGGGAYLWQLRPGSRIENTAVISNAALGFGSSGGGLHVQYGADLVIADSSIGCNQAASEGGGIFVFQPAGKLTIERTTLGENVAGQTGGATTAYLTWQGESLSLRRVIMTENQAASGGAALYLYKQGSGVTTVDLANVVLADNRLTSPLSLGAVVEARGARPDTSLALTMRHLTWAGQPALPALGLAAASGRAVSAVLTNTLIVSASHAFVGLQIAGDVRVEHSHTLAHSAGPLHTAVQGAPVFLAVSPVSGDPRLDVKYRLQRGSAAIDAGIACGADVDIDGHPRPVGRGYDIGADEWRASGQQLPLLLKGRR